MPSFPVSRDARIEASSAAYVEVRLRAGGAAIGRARLALDAPRETRVPLIAEPSGIPKLAVISLSELPDL